LQCRARVFGLIVASERRARSLASAARRRPTAEETDMTDEIRTRENEDPDGDREPVDVVEGPVGSASLREPSEVEREAHGADLDAQPTPD
jgi:hypothetical protein